VDKEKPMSSIGRRANKSSVDRQLSNWSKRPIRSWSLFGLAGVIALQYFLSRGGFQLIPLSMGWQDLPIGAPTAAVAAIAGGFALDPNPRI
jgi:hypothetical protein